MTALPAAPASAAPGQRSLATVLAADGHHFDRKWGDFDILDKAVMTVLAAKPDSAVGVLADGSSALTAFLPTDRAFRRLVHDLTGKRPRTEKATFNRLAKVAGVDTIEAVLLYHVVPGATITYSQAKASDGRAAEDGPRARHRRSTCASTAGSPCRTGTSTTRTRSSSARAATSTAATCRSVTPSRECCVRPTSDPVRTPAAWAPGIPLPSREALPVGVRSRALPARGSSVTDARSASQPEPPGRRTPANQNPPVGDSATRSARSRILEG